MSDEKLRLIGSAEASKILNISAVHLRRLTHQKKLPAPIRIGVRKLGWRLTDIAALIDGNTNISK